MLSCAGSCWLYSARETLTQAQTQAPGLPSLALGLVSGGPRPVYLVADFEHGVWPVPQASVAADAERDQPALWVGQKSTGRTVP